MPIRYHTNRCSNSLLFSVLFSALFADRQHRVRRARLRGRVAPALSRPRTSRSATPGGLPLPPPRGEVDVLAPPGGEGAQAGELAANAPRTPLAGAMRERLAEDEGAKLYRQRSGLVEPVFGWIKEIFGYRRFLWRGLSGVRAEWSLICTAVNLRKLFRYGKLAMAAG